MQIVFFPFQRFMCWRISPQYADVGADGIFKRRFLGQLGMCPWKEAVL